MILVVAVQYHIVTLAKEGLSQVVEGLSDLNHEQQTAIRNSVAINGVDGSIDDECAPLTMTIKVCVCMQACVCECT